LHNKIHKIIFVLITTIMLSSLVLADDTLQAIQVVLNKINARTKS